MIVPLLWLIALILLMVGVIPFTPVAVGLLLFFLPAKSSIE